MFLALFDIAVVMSWCSQAPGYYFGEYNVTRTDRNDGQNDENNTLIVINRNDLNEDFPIRF